MTKERVLLTFQHALCVAASVIGWDRCAAICGRTERTLRNWSDPDTDQEISILDARRIDRACLDAGADHAPFHRAFTLQLGLEGHTPADRSQALTDAAKIVAREGGEAIAAMLDAAGRPHCGPSKRRARKEVREAMAALGSADAALGEGGD
jgi:hypothetical protein